MEVAVNVRRSKTKSWFLAMIMIGAWHCANDPKESNLASAPKTKQSAESRKKPQTDQSTDRASDSGKRIDIQDTAAAIPISTGTANDIQLDTTDRETVSPPPSNVSNSDGCIEGNSFTCKAEAALVDYTNRIRKRSGLQPLTHNFKISYVARSWSIQQAGVISHNGFPAARVATYQQRFPTEPIPLLMAENVAMFTGGSDPEAVGKAFADQWENSPSHLSNILGRHGSIGVGIHCAESSQDNNSGILGGILVGSGSVCTGTQIFSN